jgi:hypothetical protein
MAIGVYDSAELLEAVELGKRFKPFLIPAAFGRTTVQDAEFLSFDEYTDDRMIMPLCNPLVAGIVATAQGFTTKSFTPAYFKAKDAIPFSLVEKRGLGQPFGTSQTFEDQLVLKGIEQQMRWDRTKEYLASQILKTGAITIAGEDGSAYELDFARTGALTSTLLTTDQWGETDVSPIDGVEAFVLLLDKPCKKMVFGSKSWKNFRNDPKFDNVVDMNYRNLTQSVLERGPIQLPEVENHMYMGTLASMGGIDLYLYKESISIAGSSVDLIAINDVLFIPDNYYGVVGYGRIKDSAANYSAMPIFMKTWQSEDPAIPYIMSQSNMLPFHVNIDATGYINTRGTTP